MTLIQCSMALFDVQNFYCGYGEMVAVSDLTFAIEAEILALLGPNGAAQDSTILAIMGPRGDQAAAACRGTDITRLPALRRSGLGLALVPEGDASSRISPGRESHGRRLQPFACRREAQPRRVFELFPRLSERRLQLSASLSGGEQQMWRSAGR